MTEADPDNLADLANAKVSIWLDDLSRARLRGQPRPHSSTTSTSPA